MSMARVMSSASAPGLTAAELREIRECEKIVHFRDTVLSGTHPRIKVPDNLVGKLNSAARSNNSFASSRAVSATSHLGAHSNGTSRNGVPHTVEQAEQLVSLQSKLPKSEINPILLEKSEDLIKAEIQLSRQRLERALREQIEQRRQTSRMALMLSESLPDFDLSDVLSIALTLVKPTSAAEAEAEAEVAAHVSASDSFDENTFYSSQHDTPEKSTTSQGSRADEAIPLPDLVPVSAQLTQPVTNTDRTASQGGVQSSSRVESVPVPAGSQGQTQKQPLPAEPEVPPRPKTVAQDMSSKVAAKPTGITISSSESTEEDSFGSNDPIGGNTRGTRGEPASPLIRANATDLAPVAPQPARVSSLATRNPPTTQQPDPVEGPRSAQVSALQQASEVSSPESSPKGGKKGGKQKGKKKKRGRKSDGNQPANADRPDSPYIKEEPKSPSPLRTARIPRPTKRQRREAKAAAELNYDDPRQEEPRPVRRSERLATTHYDQDGRPIPMVDDRELAARRNPPYEVVEPEYRRVIREPQYVSSHEQIRGPRSPMPYTNPYSPAETMPPRAVSRAASRAPESSFAPAYGVRTAEAAGPRTMRPRSSRSRSPVYRERAPSVMMAPPPRAAPRRIVVDAYGREYYEAAPPAISRQSVAPVRAADEEFLYERAPLRTVSGSRQAPVLLDDDGRAVYSSSAPRYVDYADTVSRPMYVQPERAGDYRAYRQREYSMQPRDYLEGPEYVQVRAPERRMVIDEPPREYVSRASAMPPHLRRDDVAPELRQFVPRMASVRPGEPREYISMRSSVRPEVPLYEPQTREPPLQESRDPATVRSEAPTREYSVQPGARTVSGREMMPPSRSFSVVPDSQRNTLQPGSLRQYSVRPEPRREQMREQSVFGELRQEAPLRSAREYSMRPVDEQEEAQMPPARQAYRPAPEEGMTYGFVRRRPDGPEGDFVQIRSRAPDSPMGESYGTRR